MWAWLQRNQPVSITNAVTYVGEWLCSGFSDVPLPNPHFLSVNPNDNIAIYCTHGTGDRVSAFRRFANRIMSTLPHNISAIHMTSFDERFQGKGIDDFAEQLLQKIIQNKDKRIVLWGHSRGGLVNTYLTENLAEKAGIEVVAEFAIGTPFRGSHLAVYPLTLISRSIEQMSSGSSFLILLTDKIRQSKVKRFYYAAENDGLVKLDATSIDKASTLLDRHGHLSIMSSHRLVKDVSLEINRLCQTEFKPLSDAKDEDEYIVVGDDSALEIDDAYYDVDLQIEELKNRTHLKDPSQKIQVLTKLRTALGDMIDNGRGIAYPTATSVGQFIHAFLQDETINDGVKPITCLTEPLNFSLFAQPNSQQLLEQLVQKYNAIPLRKNEVVCSQSLR
jgi:pimeloyl-ACP methyl ester carboxylesterase